MTFQQFTKTTFYKTMFDHMLTAYSKEFTQTVLKDLYFRKEHQGTLHTIA